MNAPRVRGICPGLSVPMPTGDGLLVRLRPTAPVPLDAMAGFCEASRRYGNGTIEVSARGSLQVRGLTPRSTPLFASAVAELGIAAHEGVPVIAAFDLSTQVNAAGMADELRRAIASARLVLSPKISVVVDGGGPLHLDAVSADVRLRVAVPAQGPGFDLPGFDPPRFHLGLGGDGASATWLGSVAQEDIVAAVLGILTVIGAHGRTARAAAVLRAEGAEAFRSVSAALIEPSPAPPPRRPAERIGVHFAHDGAVAVGIGLAFGHTHAVALAEVVRAAAGHGAQAVWPAPDRALLLIGVSALNALGLTAVVRQLGFVVHAGDPRRRIAACPGAPACGSGLIPARALASALTPILEPAFRPARNGVVVHISGCPKGCAHPMPAALTLVGTPDGCGIVHRGSARTAPGHYVDPANLGDEIARLATKSEEAAHG
jgi:precorrin-3B synthase